MCRGMPMMEKQKERTLQFYIPSRVCGTAWTPKVICFHLVVVSKSGGLLGFRARSLDAAASLG